MSVKSIKNKTNKINHIPRALEKRGETQAWLAEQLNVSRQHVQVWYQQKGNPNSKNLYSIAKVLDFTVTEILTGNFIDEMEKVRDDIEPFRQIIASEKESINQVITVIMEDDNLSSQQKRAYRSSIMAKIDNLIDIISE